MTALKLAAVLRANAQASEVIHKAWIGAGVLLLSLLACGALTQSAQALPDGRAWEMVSPIEKNGGRIEAPEALAGGGVLQAAANGQSVTYGSAASFGAGAVGAPPASQYISVRTPSGWATQNISTPLLSGSYGTEPEGVPYRLFSTDLARGLMLNGAHCRGGGDGCPVANPPLPGTDAPAGYQNYYLRTTATASFEALLGPAEVAESGLDAAEFDLVFSGASPDLTHVVLSTCAALTSDASEVPLGEGCDPGEPNLYLWSGGSLELINTLPGAALAAQGGAVSANGSRIYWRNLDTGNLQLSDSGVNKQVDTAAGGGGTFETASADGSVAFFTKAGHLWRYEVGTGTATDLTPAGEVLGVLGASADASRLYYLTPAGLFLRQGATTVKAADGADASNYPPAHGTARVSADGTRLIFLSSASLTGYDNRDQKTGLPVTEVFLYDAGIPQLRCISCRPNGTRPIGPSTIRGSVANGQGPGATNSYKPRILTLEGRRIFFDSLDGLVASDTNNDADVYQWESQGTGSCTKAAGCVELISSGRSEDGARFVDASTDGADVFFLDDRSLVTSDPGSVDLYDARVGGGFPQLPTPIPCIGDACQNLPPEPIDPALATLFAGPGNPPVRYRKYRRRNHDLCRRATKARKCQKGKGTKQGKKTNRAKKGGKR